MHGYIAPLRDMDFVLRELHRVEGGTHEGGLADATPILEAAAKLARDVLHPINRSGDENGCRLEGDVVITAPGFREAYRAFAEGGWSCVVAAERFGGQHLPHRVRVLAEEMTCSANLAFASYTMLVPGACEILAKHACEALQAAWLPRLVSGEFMATMCLTEAQAGSDLSGVAARATPRADGTFTVRGTKVFISAGEHDLASNIVHLVLARLPDAPAGTRGISLFLVPKCLDGGRCRNGVRCIGIEHKMGQLGASTCTLSFEDATGWLVGEPHRGLAAMFSMMNMARIGAAVQGLGIAEAAYQDAVRYARERRQGRADRNAGQGGGADAIIEHADVRRMLLTMRAYVEGMRAAVQWLAASLDDSERHPHLVARAEAAEFLALMTPVVKAMFSDLGSECANLGVQVLGGYGYIRDYGMEQRVRDVRVTQIYDGTNGIQALDLVRRKIHRQHLADRFLARARAIVAAADHPDVRTVAIATARAVDVLEQATARMHDMQSADSGAAEGLATEYLRLFGYTTLACMWTRMATVAVAQVDGPDGHFYRAKLRTATFFAQRVLPAADALAVVIRDGGAALDAFPTSAF